MRAALTLVLFALTSTASAQGWMQWGGNGSHESAAPTPGQSMDRVETVIQTDPFVDFEKELTGGALLTHYQVPLVDGDDVYLIVKSGVFSDLRHWQTQTWNVRALRRSGHDLAVAWTFPTDWKPVPANIGNGGPSWEPVYHTAVTSEAVWAPGAGGAILKIRRADGVLLGRFNPFGSTIDANTYVTGPPAADDAGNIYYNAIQVDPTDAWGRDSRGAWLVKVGADGSVSKQSFDVLATTAPAAGAQCMTAFDNSQLPWPPSANAAAPAARCGPQRPGINVAPAVGPDGTVYTISRAHLNDRWGFLIAASSDLTPRWCASMRNRFSDGCNVLIPPNGTSGGCRSGAATGVDPADNQPGSGRVRDDSTSSPVVTPDGRILYGSYTRYNYSQGHLMQFDAGGAFLTTYPWGWDLTPAIYRHDGTYSILLKENHYIAAPYCSVSGSSCPSNRSVVTPSDPEQYFITQLDASLKVEWKFKSVETKSCFRGDDGVMQCIVDHPRGFEWCVNAVAVDPRGTIYANSEDGNVYAIAQGGTQSQRMFLRLALGAAYTPLSMDAKGRIYTQNDGRVFIVVGNDRRRAAER